MVSYLLLPTDPAYGRVTGIHAQAPQGATESLSDCLGYVLCGTGSLFHPHRSYLCLSWFD